MRKYSNHSFSIVFGDEQSKFIPQDFYRFDCLDLLLKEPFRTITAPFYLESLIFLHQTHSNNGTLLGSNYDVATMKAFAQEGDFLITNRVQMGLGIATADCLPVILYDKNKDVVALVHAGWRGSVNGIIGNALNALQENFGTAFHDISVFFGPSALACCYEVDKKFVEQLLPFEAIDEVVQIRNGRYFFDVPFYNEIVMRIIGIKASQINRQFNECTICNKNYCSYRRTKGPERNITAVVLHAK